MKKPCRPFLFMLVVFFGVVFWNFLAEAQGAVSFPHCEAEIQKYCQDPKFSGDNVLCLASHSQELSESCQSELERYRELSRGASNRGGGALGAFGGINALGPPIPLLSLDTRSSPGLNSSLISENKGSLSVPLAGDPGHLVMGSVSGSDLHFGTPVTLTSGLAVPTELYRAELGALYFSKLENSRTWSMRGSLGYAGDQPFQNPHELTYSVNTNYTMPAAWNSKNTIALSLYVANNGPFGGIPIPGVTYVYKGENWTGVFGFPVVSIQWTPAFPWAYSFSLFGPTMQTELAYGVLTEGQFFTGFSLNRQSYILSQFNDNNERLTLQEMRVTVGYRQAFWTQVMGELQWGRCFNRSLFAGDSTFDDSGGLANFADDNYISASVKVRF